MPLMAQTLHFYNQTSWISESDCWNPSIPIQTFDEPSLRFLNKGLEFLCNGFGKVVKKPVMTTVRHYFNSKFEDKRNSFFKTDRGVLQTAMNYTIGTINFDEWIKKDWTTDVNKKIREQGSRICDYLIFFQYENASEYELIIKISEYIRSIIGAFISLESVERQSRALATIANFQLMRNLPQAAASIATLISCSDSTTSLPILNQAAKDLLSQNSYEDAFEIFRQANSVRALTPSSVPIYYGKGVGNPENDENLLKAFRDNFHKGQIGLAHQAAALITNPATTLVCFVELVQHAITHKDLSRIIDYSENLILTLDSLAIDFITFKAYTSLTKLARHDLAAKYSDNPIRSFFKAVTELNLFLDENGERELAKKLKNARTSFANSFFRKPLNECI